MFGTFRSSDVTLLLKDISSEIQPMDLLERERLVQRGFHYSELLPLEYVPSTAYMDAYYKMLNETAGRTAVAVTKLAQTLYYARGKDIVLVSLARAGIPVGVLLKHSLKRQFGVDVPHYAISVIKGKGIDHTAMNYILQRHSPENIQFVDGWTGKGTIQYELDRAMEAYPPSLSSGLAVLYDPAGVAEFCSYDHDAPIASAFLNAQVTGLISRTVYSESLIGPSDFHGAVFYKDLLHKDLTYQFIGMVEGFFPHDVPTPQDEIAYIQRTFNIENVNWIKPSIGETIRVLLRRVPWTILVSKDAPECILQLAKERGVPVLHYPLVNYAAVGLVRKVHDATIV